MPRELKILRVLYLCAASERWRTFKYLNSDHSLPNSQILDNISVVFFFFTLQISVVIILCSAFARHPFRNLRSFWTNPFFLERGAVRFANPVSLFRVQLHMAVVGIRISRSTITSSPGSFAATVKSATSPTDHRYPAGVSSLLSVLAQFRP